MLSFLSSNLVKYVEQAICEIVVWHGMHMTSPNMSYVSQGAISTFVISLVEQMNIKYDFNIQSTFISIKPVEMGLINIGLLYNSNFVHQCDSPLSVWLAYLVPLLSNISLPIFLKML